MGRVRPNVYEEQMRADRAEDALRSLERRLARVLQLADAWETEYGDSGMNAVAAAESIRLAVRHRRV